MGLSERAFESVASEHGDLALPLLCRSIAAIPTRDGEDSEIGRIQRAFHAGEFHVAFSLLADYLDLHGLTAEPVYEIDRRQFRHQRDLQNIKQRDLAMALGVTSNAITQLERRGGYLKLPKLLVAADFFGVSPRAILIVQTDIPPPGRDVARLDKARRKGGNDAGGSARASG